MNEESVSADQIESLRYPMGRFIVPDKYNDTWKANAIDSIRYLPHNVELSIENMDEDFLQTSYRPGGWTVHQLIHYLAHILQEKKQFLM